MLDVSFLAVSLGIGLVLVFILMKMKENYRLPPGPWGVPVVGFYPFFSRDPHIHLAKLSKHYNSEIISFRVMGGTIIALNSAKAIKEVLVSRAEEFAGKPHQMTFHSWIDDGLGVIQNEGNIYREHRRFSFQTLKELGFGKERVESHFHNEIRLLLKKIADLNQEPFNPVNYITHTVNSVISQVLFGKRYKTTDFGYKVFYESFYHFYHVLTSSRLFLIGPALRLFLTFTSQGQKAKKAKKLLFEEIDNNIKEHIATFDPDHIRDFIDGYLHQMKISEGKKEGDKRNGFSLNHLRSLILNLLMEGSVSITVSCLIATLSNQPEAQAKAQKEIDSVVGDERLPGYGDRAKLPYLQAVILELFRTSLPVNISSFYSNFEETKVWNYRIPKRTVILANYWSVRNDPTAFPEPSKFDPTRFLDSDGNKIKNDGLLTFGLGKRTCVGESFAQMEVFLVIAALLQNFNLHLVSKNKIRVVPRTDRRLNFISEQYKFLEQ